MGKPLDDRNVEFLFDTKWLIQWNTPVNDESSSPIAYNHNAILIFDMESSGRKTYTQYQQKMNLGFSNNPLTLNERLTFISDSTTLNKIKNQIISNKLDKTGYQYTEDDAPPKHTIEST